MYFTSTLSSYFGLLSSLLLLAKSLYAFLNSILFNENLSLLFNFQRPICPLAPIGVNFYSLPHLASFVNTFFSFFKTFLASPYLDLLPL